MLAQSTSALTEGARRMKRNRFATTKATKTSPATRNIAGGSRSGRKWLIHLPTTAGIASNTATTNVRRRFATRSEERRVGKECRSGGWTDGEEETREEIEVCI